MMPLRFAWDEAKNRENLKKHGVSFAEAQTVFYDDQAIEFYDNPHSAGSSRISVFGFPSNGGD